MSYKHYLELRKKWNKIIEDVNFLSSDIMSIAGTLPIHYVKHPQVNDIFSLNDVTFEPRHPVLDVIPTNKEIHEAITPIEQWGLKSYPDYDCQLVNYWDKSTWDKSHSCTPFDFVKD
jgi:hypothetical protein